MSTPAQPATPRARPYNPPSVAASPLQRMDAGEVSVARFVVEFQKQIDWPLLIVDVPGRPRATKPMISTTNCEWLLMQTGQWILQNNSEMFAQLLSTIVCQPTGEDAATACAFVNQAVMMVMLDQVASQLSVAPDGIEQAARVQIDQITGESRWREFFRLLHEYLNVTPTDLMHDLRTLKPLHALRQEEQDRFLRGASGVANPSEHVGADFAADFADIEWEPVGDDALLQQPPPAPMYDDEEGADNQEEEGEGEDGEEEDGGGGGEVAPAPAPRPYTASGEASLARVLLAGVGHSQALVYLRADSEHADVMSVTCNMEAVRPALAGQQPVSLLLAWLDPHRETTTFVVVRAHSRPRYAHVYTLVVADEHDPSTAQLVTTSERDVVRALCQASTITAPHWRYTEAYKEIEEKMIRNIHDRDEAASEYSDTASTADLSEAMRGVFLSVPS